MQDLSNQHESKHNELDEERPKDINFVIPMEFDDKERIGNQYKELLANPATRTMDYGHYCLLPGTEITREKCERGLLLEYLYKRHKEKNPDLWERGIPGDDLKAFMKFPLECRTCLLYRYSPMSPENVKDGGRAPQEVRDRKLWGGLGGAIIALFTMGAAQDFLETTPLTGLLLGLFLGGSIFTIVLGKFPSIHRDHAHGPREANSSPRGVLRPRGNEVPMDHEGTRYREVDLEHPFDAQAAPPAAANTEGKAEPTPHIQATAPSVIVGGNTTQTPEPARDAPAQTMKGPGQTQMEIVVPAKWAEPPAPAKEVLPVKPEAAPIKESAPAVPPAPPAPANPSRSPRQPSKKVPAKGKKAPAKKAEPKVEERKEPVKQPAPVKEPTVPAVTGFPCDHPGCGKVCKNPAALKSHKLTHKKAGASPQASKN